MYLRGLCIKHDRRTKVDAFAATAASDAARARAERASVVERSRARVAMADKLRGALANAKNRVQTAVQNQRERRTGSDDATTVRASEDVRALREQLREALEHGQALERAQAALNGEMRRQANANAELKKAAEAAQGEKEEIRQRAATVWSQMTAQIEELKAELSRARARTEGKGGDVDEEALDELEQKAHTEARAIKKVLLEEREKFEMEKQTLKERISELETLLASSREGVARSGESSKETAAMHEDAREARARVAQLESSIEGVKSESEAKVKELESQVKSIRIELEAQVASAKTQLVQAQSSSGAATQALETQLASMQSELQATQLELESKSAALEQAQSSLVQARSSSGTAIEEHSITLETLSEAEVRLGQLQTELDEANATTSALRGVSDELAEERIRNEDLQAHLVTLRSLEKKEKKNEEDMKVASEEIARQKAEIDRLQTELNAARKIQSQADASQALAAHDMESRLKNLQSELESTRATMQEVESASSSDKQQLEATNARLSEQAGANERMRAELQAKTDALTRAESSSTTAMEEVSAQLAFAQAALNAKTEELERANDARESMQSKLSALQVELQTKHDALEVAQASSGTAHELEKEVEAIRAELAAVRAQLLAKEHKLASFEEQASSTRNELQEKLEKSLKHAREQIQLVTEASETKHSSLAIDLETLKANLASAETRNAVMNEELRLTNEALSRSSAEVASIVQIQTQFEQLSARHKESEVAREHLKESLRVANERLVVLEERLKEAEENDATTAEALRTANEEAAKAKDNVASVASASATQFAQERQMMKNALGELQTERDILVKMLKTFHSHGVIHSTSETPQDSDAGSASDFTKRFTEAPSLASVFTPRKRAPYVDTSVPPSPASPN